MAFTTHPLKCPLPHASRQVAKVEKPETAELPLTWLWHLLTPVSYRSMITIPVCLMIAEFVAAAILMMCMQRYARRIRQLKGFTPACITIVYTI